MSTAQLPQPYTNTPFVDGKGLACPQPVLLAKKTAESGAEHFVLRVDNEAAVYNVGKWAQSAGYTSTEIGREANLVLLGLSRSAEAAGTAGAAGAAGAAATPRQSTEGWTCLTPDQGTPFTLFVGKDHVGEGDPELGGNLAKMLFFTLTQSEHKPAVIAFMNSGVFLATRNEQVVEHLKVLESQGVKILVCGTCVNFYGITELPVGDLSNMYEIWESLTQGGKVVSL